MHLCGASLSPYYERPNLVARFKGAEKEQIQLGGMPFEMKSETHLALVPTGKIPFLLLDDGDVLIESQIIAEYLDAVLSGPSLMPDTPIMAAKARLICRVVDFYMAPCVERFWSNRGYSDGDRAQVLEKDLPTAWDILERYIGDDGYAVGGEPSIADMALIPWIFHFESFVARHGDWGVGERPKLINWFAHMGSGDLAAASKERSLKSFEVFRSRVKQVEDA